VFSDVNGADSVVFWATLALTCALCLATLWRAVQMPERLTEAPLFIGAMWLYFYGFMAVGVALHLASYIPNWALELGQALALACLVATLVGWRSGRKRGQPVGRSSLIPRYDVRRMWWIGIGLIIVGGISHWLFLGEGEVDWEGTSAYWYMLFHVIYPGVALCMTAWASEARYRKLAYALPLAATGVLALYPNLVGARRGPVFPAVIVLVLVPPLVARTIPKRSRIVGGIVVAGCVMLLFLAVRPWLYEGGRVFRGEDVAARWSGALGRVTAEEIFVNRVLQEGDNEFLYHCGMVGTIAERESYQYGTGYLSLFTHWIPRQWWSGKPALGQGIFPDAASQIPFVMGWSLSGGASAGGVAEVFNQFGFASPLLWFAFGYAMAALYRRTKGGDVRWGLAYVGVLCASHWLVSQGVAAAFVPACIYVVVPLIALRIARAQPQRVPRKT